MFGKYISHSSRLLNRVLPHHCPICDCETSHYGLCAACWSGLSFITAPICLRCGRPVFGTAGTDLCVPYLQDPPLLQTQRALLRYDEGSKALILPFKHASRLDLTPLLAQMMLASFQELVSDEHLIIPVPLHITRRLYRSYNQSAELARHLCTLSDRRGQFDPLMCYRRKATRPLGKHNAKVRAKILKGAFAIRPKRLSKLKGRKILIIDDVRTTGYTTTEMARTLLQAGATQVDSLTLARIL